MASSLRAQITVEPPKSKAAILQYLCAGSIRGIGPQLAKQLVNTFGIDTLDVITDTLKNFCKLKALARKSLHLSANPGKHSKALRSWVIFKSHGIGPARAIKIHKRYGADTVAIIQRTLTGSIRRSVVLDF